MKNLINLYTVEHKKLILNLMASNTSHAGWKAGKETAGKVSGVKKKKSNVNIQRLSISSSTEHNVIKRF